MPAAAPVQAVQVYGRKKTATAVATCKAGKGLIKVNGKPLDQIEPKALQYKLQEPLLIVGKERFAGVDIRIRVTGLYFMKLYLYLLVYNRWWSHCSGLCHQTGCCSWSCCVLPKVR